MTLLSRLHVLRPCQGLVSGSRLINTTTAVSKWGDVFIPPRKKLEECPPDYKESPERDLVNFPRPQKHMFSPKVRLGLIPDSWFTFMYNKTGVTGPYVLGVGVLAFLLNKELYVITNENKMVISFILFNYIIAKKWGANIASAYYNSQNYQDELKENIDTKKREITNCIDESKDVVDRCKAWSDSLFQAQRDQVSLMLEEDYRKRLVEYRNAVKRKMDYLVDIDDTKKRFQRQHIVDWVVDQVRKSIDDKVQNAAFAQCVMHLKTLSAKANI